MAQSVNKNVLRTKAQPSAGSNVRTDRSLGTILVVLVVLLMLVNIPINVDGLGLAHLNPETANLVIRDGMLITGPASANVYLVQNYKLRLISGPEASRRYFSGRPVRAVDERLLAQFGQGPPIRYLTQCAGRAEIFAVEHGQKRWVRQPRWVNKRLRWDKINVVSCTYLDRLPTGLPLAEDVDVQPRL